MAIAPAALVRRRLEIAGVVQGVGFRPFVHGLATRLHLAGFVGNHSGGVFIEVEGSPDEVAAFEDALRREAPPLASITSLRALPVPPRGEHGFRIVASRHAAGASTLVPPDVATCDDCLAELFDPADRRYRYPFVNCTACGPRFTIIEALPYDRPLTTMAGFAMCPECAREYHDPADRRFHAQPTACPSCGPSLSLVDADGTVSATGDAALLAAQAHLAAGRIVAVKGLGGYHLVCDASNGDAVAELRRRKARGAKPFAVLVPDVAAARRLAVVGTDEAILLAAPQRPIVLVARRRGSHGVVDDVAPDNPLLGLLLPYTPLHHLLVRPAPGGPVPPTALVCTSANRAGEPIAFDDADAAERLDGLADCVLTHDRPIHVPCDDSVVRVVAGAESPLRRSRGHAPLPVQVPSPVRPVLAVGGELKTAFCVARDHQAWLSQHIGDMGTLETLHAFERSVRQFERTYGVVPEIVASDAHPGYVTTRWAAEVAATLGVPHRLVQHHRAHLASLLTEHGLAAADPVIGVVFDGTGFGDDGTIWGGEVFVGGPAGVRRAAHLAPVPLPGGDAAITRPYRSALAHLWAAGLPWDPHLPPVAACPALERGVLARQLDGGFGAVPSSSMGRLFDAVASLAGVRHEAWFEAEAAIELEALVRGEPGAAYRFALTGADPLVLDPGPVVEAVAADVTVGMPAAVVAARFHAAVADAVAAVAVPLRRTTGITTVGLSGGCFQNAVLTGWTGARLRSAGFDVLVHRRIPANDGGLALGQAVLAAGL